MGSYKYLYGPDSLLTGKEDAASNFARGYYTIGHEIIQLVTEKIRKLAEDCEHLQGFISFRATGGGTGSGFTTLVLEELSDYFEKSTKMEFAITPSPKVCIFLDIQVNGSNL